MSVARLAHLEHRLDLYEEVLADLALAAHRLRAEIAALRRQEQERRAAARDKAEVQRWYGRQVRERKTAPTEVEAVAGGPKPAGDIAGGVAPKILEHARGSGGRAVPLASDAIGSIAG